MERGPVDLCRVGIVCRRATGQGQFDRSIVWLGWDKGLGATTRVSATAPAAAVVGSFQRSSDSDGLSVWPAGRAPLPAFNMHGDL